MFNCLERQEEESIIEAIIAKKVMTKHISKPEEKKSTQKFMKQYEIQVE